MSALSSILDRWRHVQSFRQQQHREGVVVADSPYFESEECVEFFTFELAHCGHYVEFGSGGSTMLAAKHHKPSVSVESDLYYLGCVRQALIDRGLFNANLQTLSGVDIGPTIEWGRPWRNRYLSHARRRAFARYSDFPSQAGSSVDDPVLVLVDGRFRVACALKSLRALRGQKGWTLIVDDYTGRSEYHVIENFATAERFVGRMAVFRSLTLHEPSALDDAIQQYQRDPD